METYTCSLCGIQIYPGHGSIYVKNNYKIYRFCKSKCSKLFHLKKNPFFLRWTSINRKIKGKKLYQKKNDIENINYCNDTNKNYNSYLIFKTLYIFKRTEKIHFFKCIDFKLNKKMILNSK
jgi:large subunit ribosomal protein L24e